MHSRCIKESGGKGVSPSAASGHYCDTLIICFLVHRLTCSHEQEPSFGPEQPTAYNNHYAKCYATCNVQEQERPAVIMMPNSSCRTARAWPDLRLTRRRYEDDHKVHKVIMYMNGTVKELEFGLRMTYTLFCFFLAALKLPSSRPSRYVIFGAREAAHVSIASRQWTMMEPIIMLAQICASKSGTSTSCFPTEHGGA